MGAGDVSARGRVVDSRHGGILAAIVLAGIVLRLVFALGYWVGQPLTRDEQEYLSLARSLASGHGYVYDPVVQNGPVQPFGRAPGYPVFLALTGGGRDVVLTVPTSVKVAQSLVGGLGIILVAVLATRIAGPRAGRIAAGIAAIYPPLVCLSAYAYSEAVFWPVGLLVALVLDRLAAPDRVAIPAGRGLAAGVLIAAAILLRAALTLLLPIVTVWLLVRRRPRHLLALAAGTALILLPWAARNYVHDGRFVLVASDGGVTFWTGNNSLATGEGDMAANPALKRESQRLHAAHPTLTEQQMEPVYYDEAFTWMRGHPAAWLQLEVRKLFYLVVPIGPSYRLHSRRYYLLSAASYLAVLPLAIIGLRRAGRGRQRVPGLWLMLAAAVATCLVFFPQERFRLPVIDPVLVVLAGCAFARRAGTAAA
jgi:hypothetical protein